MQRGRSQGELNECELQVVQCFDGRMQRDDVVKECISIPKNMPSDDVSLLEGHWLSHKNQNQVVREEISKIISAYMKSLQEVVQAQQFMSFLSSESQLNSAIRTQHHQTNTKFHATTRRHVKATNSYNQLADETLVQYFYTKRKIFKQTGNKPNRQKINIERKENNFIPASASDKRFYINKNPNFVVRMDKPKLANQNRYDLLSCKSSLSSRKQTRLANQIKPITAHMPIKPQELLKSRMICLESQVYSRIPCLVQMGVRFKRLRRR